MKSIESLNLRGVVWSIKGAIGLPVLTLMVLLQGCVGYDESVNLAKGSVAQIHEHYNQQNFGQILELSHEKFKKANSREKIERVLGSLYVRFGKVISTQTEKSEVENRNFATIVRIVQKTEFQNGTAIEIFGFQLEDGRAALRQYEIETTGLEGFEPER